MWVDHNGDTTVSIVRHQVGGQHDVSSWTWYCGGSSNCYIAQWRLPLPDDDERVYKDEDDDNDGDDVHRQNNRNDGFVTRYDLIRTAFQ